LINESIEFEKSNALFAMSKKRRISEALNLKLSFNPGNMRVYDNPDSCMSGTKISIR